MLNFNIKHTLKVILLVMGVLTLFDACRKETIIVPRSPFTIIFNNEYNLLQARFGAFISGENGKVLAFRWLDGHDTTHLGLPFSDFKHYNCTVIKIIVQL